jgi:long-chain acyl-CoA synthetase
LREGHSATKEEIFAHCKQELAPFKAPRDIEFLPELPKSSMMKILRRELRDKALRQTGK